MGDVKWIKMVTNIFDNRKIRQIETLPEGDAIIVIWVKLLCLAGNINDAGFIYLTKEIPYTDQMLSTQFRVTLPTLQLAMSTFEQFGMIEVVDDILHISNWEKYQNVDGMEKIREQNRLRQKRWYDNQKALPNVRNNVSITQPNATEEDIEEDKDIDIDKRESIGRKRFTPPTVEEVKAYIDEKGYTVNPNTFVDYYTSNDWKVGKNKMKDWKACVRTWQQRENPRPADQIGRSDGYDDDLQKRLLMAAGGI